MYIHRFRDRPCILCLHHRFFRKHGTHCFSNKRSGIGPWRSLLAPQASLASSLSIIFSTLWLQKKPRHIQKGIGIVANLFYFILHGLNSRQKHSKKSITSYFWINGYPPKDEEWLVHNRNEFKDYKLKIHGLVEKPIELSLADLEALPKETQITRAQLHTGMVRDRRMGRCLNENNH